ncbi:MAG: methionyl-tRNA formyltransferase [Vicinamibacterales bacterium]
MKKPALRVVFFGTPAFAVPTLERLLASSHHVVGVVTQPDRPRGRGQQLAAGPVKALALSMGLPVLQPDRLARDQFEPPFTQLGADIGVVAAYGKLLPDWLLAGPPRGLINVHASLLPRYRGASPIHRAVMNGDAETGVTIMRVVKVMDSGAILDQVRVPIGLEDTTAVLSQRLAIAGATLLVETLDRMVAGPIVETPQDDTQATSAPRLVKTDGLIDWSRPAAAIHNQVRGLSPWPHAYSFLAGTRYIIHRSTGTRSPTALRPGTIAAASAAEGVLVACGDGRCLELVEVQLEGKRVLAARDLLGGGALGVGARFENR